MFIEILLALHILVLGGVDIQQSTINILVDLRTITNVPLVVTSAKRTSLQQARLLAYQYKYGKNLTKLYGKKIVPLLVYLRKHNIAKIVEYLDKNPHIFSHLCGNAVDIRDKNLNRHQIQEILNLEVVYPDKYDTIKEYNPSHIHIELRKGC